MTNDVFPKFELLLR